MNRLFSILTTTIFIAIPALAADIVTPARQAIERQTGVKTENVQFKPLDKKYGNDAFSITAKKGKLTISANSSVAMCYAFSKYMREACGSMVTWSGANMNIPEKWQNYESGVIESPYNLRYFLNVCTFGYTAPYWDWTRWEREIDWMAMHGVNMPLACVASEAIAERVWLKLGLSKESVREFFTGAAYLPWHRMGNLNSWSGPLTDEWQKGQIELQHKIINRMRELGMKPVAPAFAGFVPMDFVAMHPDIKYNHLKWGGFHESLNAYVLPPDSPYFETIGKMFVEEWEKEFGENTYYISDSFNEMELPVDPDDRQAKMNTLANYGESIYKSIKAGNPDAVWVTQGWTFGYQHKFWDRESLAALLSRVPDDKMIIIDLGNDYPKWVWHTEQTWKNHDGFYGKQWIFSYVPNFGGKNLLTGELDQYATSSSDALNAVNKGNLVGFGSAPEGLENNEVVYELLADMGWTRKPIDLNEWLASYCDARYGKHNASMLESWQLMRKSAYSALRSYPRFMWQTVVFDKRRVSRVDMDDNFMKAVEKFVACSNEYKSSQLYVNDAIELASYYIAVKADKIYKEALHNDSIGNTRIALGQSAKVVEMLLDIDKLLASHPTMRLGNWVGYARNWGTNTLEKQQYEADAKRLITTWGGFQEDYAARFWSGLIKDYYVPRIQLYFSSNRNMLDAWEEGWINSSWTDTTEPFADPVAAAQLLVNKYR